jgi:hypothetical protein
MKKSSSFFKGKFYETNVRQRYKTAARFFRTLFKPFGLFFV